MTVKKADLLLHPVRLRILTALARQQLTAQGLALVLSDVPQATLYRHLNTLAKNDVLKIVEERQVRGTVEKVYTLNESAGQLGPDELANASHDDLMRYFTTFLMSTLHDFSHYLERDEIRLVEDGVGFNSFPLYLSDEEFRTFVAEFSGLVQRMLANEPSPERTRRMMSMIIMPAQDEPSPHER